MPHRRELYLLGGLPRTFLECAQVPINAQSLQVDFHFSDYPTYRDLERFLLKPCFRCLLREGYFIVGGNFKKRGIRLCSLDVRKPARTLTVCL
jgi:hypothetical protein